VGELQLTHPVATEEALGASVAAAAAAAAVNDELAALAWCGVVGDGNLVENASALEAESRLWMEPPQMHL
jgi:hypothetical protein